MYEFSIDAKKLIDSNFYQGNFIDYNDNNISNDHNNLTNISTIISGVVTTNLTSPSTTTTTTIYDTNNNSLNSNLNTIDNLNKFNNNTLFNSYLDTAEIINDYLSYYYTPVLVLTGSIGNILSVIVFFKTKLKKLSSSYYLSALAVSDTCFLFGLFIQWLNVIDITLYNRNILCQFFTFFISLCSFLSVWFVVAFTVERFIAVMYPLKRQTMCTIKRAKLVLCGLTLLGTLHCIPYIYFASPIYDSNTNSTICDIRLEYKEFMIILNYIDTAVVFAIPLTTIIILNAFTGYTVWKFATVRRTMTVHKRKRPGIVREQLSQISYREGSTMLRKQSSLSTHPNGTNSISFNNSIRNGGRKITNSSQIKVTKMLLIVSTVFVFLNLPSYVMRVQAYLEQPPSKPTIVIQYICWYLFLTNFGINFVLYCVSGQNFRRAVISLFSKAVGHRDGGTQVTVSEYIRTSGIRTSRKRTISHTSDSQWADVLELKHIVSYKTSN